KNFLYNTEIEAMLTFTSSGAAGDLRQVVPDAGAITMRQHHSFVRLPDNNYKPRKHDPRSAIGAITYMDFSTPVDQSITKRFIRRFRLEKKDPNAKVSEAVKPLIYYIDRGVPEPIRSALVEGANWWNEAFEAIGYKNAFQAKVMPEGADPLDIRYNVINWVHNQQRGWSSGGGVTDPRTGEIIKGAVTLGSQRIRQDYLLAQALKGNFEKGKNNSSELLEMALLRIRQLSCHEVGHTLGYDHNYASSVNDRASVMDYPHALIKLDRNGEIDFSDAYTKGIGAWDKVTVAYSYSDFPDGVNENEELDKILSNAFSSGLLFVGGSGGAHPLTHTWDNGKHPVDELLRMMKVRTVALNTFSEKRIPIGSPLTTLEEPLVLAYLLHRYQIEAAGKVIGGLYYNHNVRGGVQELQEIVPPTEQRNALDALLTTIKPENLVIDDKILKLISPRAPVYGQTRELFSGYTGPTFDPFGPAENVANFTLSSIFNADRAARLVDYHSRDNKYPGLGEVIDKVINSTWKSTHISSHHAEIQRLINSVVLNKLIGLAANVNAAPQVRATSSHKLDQLKEWLNQQKDVTNDENQKDLFYHGIKTIEHFQANPENFSIPAPLATPPGAPIGG
ncbi:zinc-dependent metalloprotease, partial [candidate division KSB1 bacterium]